MKINFTFITLILTFMFSNLIGQEVSLVKDIAPGDDGGMNYGYIVGSFESSIVFQTLEDGAPKVLYVTDGTTDGTKEVMGLEDFQEVRNTVLIDNSLFVIAKLNSSNYSLIKFSEGKDPLVLLSNWDYLNHMIKYDEKLYFNGKRTDESEYLYALELSDNSLVQHTQLHWLHNIKDMAIYNNDLFYISGVETDALGLYKFNSSLNDSELVYDFKQINNYYTNISMIATNDFLFFTYLDLNGDYSLFSSDGTTIGTIVLDNTLSQESYFDVKNGGGLVSYNNRIYIRVLFDNDDNRYLLESDGTILGTKKLGLGSEYNLWPKDMMIVDDVLYMIGLEKVLKLDEFSGNLEEVLSSSISNIISELVQFQKSLCFIEKDSNGKNNTIWLSDITTGQEDKLNLIVDNSIVKIPTQMTSAGDKVYFVGGHNSYGYELFVYKGDPNSIQTLQSNYIDFDVFPNPAKNQINVPTELIKGDIVVYDMTGRKVLSKSNYVGTTLDVKHLENGTYFIDISLNGDFYKSKFVVQR